MFPLTPMWAPVSGGAFLAHRDAHQVRPCRVYVGFGAQDGVPKGEGDNNLDVRLCERGLHALAAGSRTAAHSPPRNKMLNITRLG